MIGLDQLAIDAAVTQPRLNSHCSSRPGLEELVYFTSVLTIHYGQNSIKINLTQAQVYLKPSLTRIACQYSLKINYGRSVEKQVAAE
jgi:hypothetical protein